MKKYLFVALFVALGFVVFNGCAQKKTETTTVQTAAEQTPGVQKKKGKIQGQSEVVPPAPGEKIQPTTQKESAPVGIQKQKNITVEPVQKTQPDQKTTNNNDVN